MTVRTVNLCNCELGESLEEAGFRHVAASIADLLGAQRIHASVYEAFAGHPIWPYHYHYSSEEWLYVISGTPVLRDAGGQRALRGGDLLCFPPDHRGAHTLSGPGRFVIFSTNESPGPWVTVYPDSDKVSVSPGHRESTDLNVMLLPRSGALDYWHGEGAADPPAPASIQREPADTPSLPLINTLEVSLNDPVGAAGVFTSRAAALGPALGGAGLDAAVVELDPGRESAPYHYEVGREEWVLILSGSATLRTPSGEDVLEAGEVVCCPEGPRGARQLVNRGSESTRAIFLWTTGLPAAVCYPDSGIWMLRRSPGDGDITLRDCHA